MYWGSHERCIQNVSSSLLYCIERNNAVEFKGEGGAGPRRAYKYKAKTIAKNKLEA